MWPRRHAHLTALAAAGLLMAAPASGQHVVSGFPRINQSDVSGPSLTSGDLLTFEPGTVQSVGCAAAWAIRTEARAVEGLLDSLRLTTADSAGRVLNEFVLRDLDRLLAGGPMAGAAAERILAALAPDSLQGPKARRDAGRLVRRLEGLFALIGRMDPRDPGRAAPTRMYEAIGAWNDFVDSSSPAFLASPPDEMLAIQAVLSRLDYGALAHARRDGDTEDVDAFGLACAAAAPVAELVELPFTVCVLDRGDFRLVQGVFLPSTGDSLVGTERHPLSVAYPDRAGYALGAAWFTRDQPISFGGREYRQWGMSRVVQPGELTLIGQHRGIGVFAAPEDGSAPDVVYLPFRSGCEVQAYRRVTEYRRVRG